MIEPVEQATPVKKLSRAGSAFISSDKTITITAQKTQSKFVTAQIRENVSDTVSQKTCFKGCKPKLIIKQSSFRSLMTQSVGYNPSMAEESQRSKPISDQEFTQTVQNMKQQTDEVSQTSENECGQTVKQIEQQLSQDQSVCKSDRTVS